MTKPDQLKSDITRFCDYFDSQVKDIETLQSSHDELYRKLLFVAVLDTLSGTVMPRRKNKERFVGFVQRFCRWSDGSRVSLPHLVQLLRKNPDPALDSLRKWALQKYSQLPVHSGALMHISEDPLLEAVKREWPSSSDQKIPIEGIDVMALTHSHLLYTYRNALVHELRMPGYGMTFGDKEEEPYYHGSSTVGEDPELILKTVELVYPWRFLSRLCTTGVAEMRGYLLANELNPYDSFTFGTYWLKELNR
ncbi:hypothetical protein [Azospira restricta]|uniref:Uncharacterized protein n=1 Tax=Azospira restricta TaxID=404405 RepID=A0A974SQW2_9RHOO|nr:hypothetical protein [Azospira restricta]QRJ64739.1 hypothetical protein IWH25_05155 [Azospira restricta]